MGQFEFVEWTQDAHLRLSRLGKDKRASDGRREAANHAAQPDPSLIQRASEFYAQYPSRLVQALGAGAAIIHLESRRVSVAGITRHPDQEWMEQIARSATQETWGCLHPYCCVLHDRDTKFCASFRSVLAAGGVKAIPFRPEARI